MAYVVRELISNLADDPFRIANPFEQSVRETVDALLKSQTDSDSEKALGDWLAKYQPCLFGRIAARLGALSYCFLREEDLAESDEVIHEKIQEARLHWRHKAFDGESSGFLIVAVSPKIANAIPNETMRALARRLCLLYLGRDDLDEILLDDVFLRVPGKDDAEIHWRAGVNYFSAQGDQRWWHDHRIPAGMAFSINSVGHLVRSFQVGRSLEEAWQKLGLAKEGWRDFKVNSLGQALIYAMQTINGAADTISGKATDLLQADRPGANPRKLKCPIDLPKNLQEKDFCAYHGYYHTDITLPSEYFISTVERPANISGHELDFTYLFNQSVDNPSFEELGRGIRVKSFFRKKLRWPKPKPANINKMIGVETVIRDKQSP